MGAVRWKMGLLVALGLVFLIGGVVSGVLAVGQAGLSSAYSRAAICPSAAAFDADCVQTVNGSVTAIVEFGGKDSRYELDVQVGSRELDIAFPTANSMLGYATDGDPAEITVWRGIPVAVTTDGRSATPSSLPGYAAATDLGRCMECLGISPLFLFAPLLQRRQGRAGKQVLGPLGLACLIAVGLGGAAIAAAGMLLAKDPDAQATILIGAGVALAVILALSAWAGLSAKRRYRKSPELRAAQQALAAGTHDRRYEPRFRPTVPLRASLGQRLRPAGWLPALWALLKSYAAPTLVVLVLFGLFFMASDAPNARAFRSAPACQGETNLSVCVGDFTATVNGVRTASPNAGSASISYVTGDGVINAWGGFSGSGAALAATAESEEAADVPVQIEVWHGAIVGAEIGGSWHWANDNPPGDRNPAVLLAVSLMLLLLLVRRRAHRSVSTSAYAGARIVRRALLRDDLGQVTVQAAGYVLLLYGYWYGALLILGVLGWMGWPARWTARILARAHKSRS